MNEKVIKSQKTLTDQFTSYEWFFFVEIAHFLSHLNGVVKNLTKWNNNLALESSLEEEIQACRCCDQPKYSFLQPEIPSHSDDSSTLQERARENFEMNNQTKGERNEKVI